MNQQALVGDFLDDGVLEHVGRLGHEALLVDDFEGFQLSEEAFELSAEPSDPLEQTSKELSADDGGELHGSLTVPAETIQARHDDALDGRGDVDLIQALREAVAAILPTQDPEVQEHLRDLFDEERDTFGLG